MKAQKRFYSHSADDPMYRKMETGNGDYSPATDLPFGYYFSATTAMKIRDVADALGCSIDYILGRTDRMEVVSDSDTNTSQENVSNPGTGWQTGDPEECGTYLLCLYSEDWLGPQYESWNWNGTYWEDFTGPHNPEIDGEIKGWISTPEWR